MIQLSNKFEIKMIYTVKVMLHLNKIKIYVREKRV